MGIRLGKPASTPQYEEWAAILERVAGDVLGVDELAHTIETDDESVWILAYHGVAAAGIGVGRPSSIAGSLHAMARVLPEHRRLGVPIAVLPLANSSTRRSTAPHEQRERPRSATSSSTKLLEMGEAANRGDFEGAFNALKRLEAAARRAV